MNSGKPVTALFIKLIVRINADDTCRLKIGTGVGKFKETEDTA